MTTRELVVLVWSIEAGRIRKDTRGRLTLRYDDAWRQRPEAVALSVSMPLAAAEHGHDAVDAFLSGLLPDNEFILDRWARNFHVSSRSSFALISQVGEDCAGAAQFVAPDRVESLRGAREMQVEWLTEDDVAARLRTLRDDQSAWRIARDRGQFSLAGSQPKTAFLHLEGRWGVPSGRTPTTHILKPPMRGLDGHAENEHLCLRLARAVGLPTAESRVGRFGEEVAIVVSRYDRTRTADLADAAAAVAAAHAAEAAAAAAEAVARSDAAARAASAAAEAASASARAEHLGELARTEPILRLHQEDVCQALAVRPALKYQNEGGPSPGDIVALIREHSERPAADVAMFLDALAFNWLIAGTDAHAKNYSFLHGRGGRVRLAPLYDLASALPYPEMDPRRIQLAMRIGSEYRVHNIGRRHWAGLARELELDPEDCLARIAETAGELARAIPEVRAQARDEGLDHPIVERLSALLSDRAARCLRALGAG